MRKITEIIVHCTDTIEGVNWTVEDIRKWHTAKPPKGNGWSDIGYHYVIYLDGTIHKGCEESAIGAHCLNHNANSIGVCYVGGKERGTGKAKDTRTPKQKEALISLLMKLVCKYPDAKIYGHRDFSNRKCPCFDAKEEYKTL